MRVTDEAKEVGCSQRVAIDLFNFVRDVRAQYFLDHPIAIGGSGKIVEIDEVNSANGNTTVGGWWTGIGCLGG